MSTSLFYHYTDAEGAESILRSGKILTSLEFKAKGDAGFGNGVYLTKRSPQNSTKEEIAINNWTKSSPQFIKKTKKLFVIKIPDSDVKDLTANGRDIFLYGGRNDLRLVKYRWWLKNFDETDEIIASYRYKITSLGPAALKCPYAIGDYRMSEDTANGRPVYEHEANENCLFMSSFGNWVVGPDAGKDAASLRQVTKSYSLGPSLNFPWQYFANNKSNKDDATLRSFAWQM